MRLIKFNNVEKYADVQTETFCIDEIVPLCYKDTPEGDRINILFMIYEDNRERTFYLSSQIQVETKEDREYIEKNKLFLPNIAKSEDATDRYKELTLHLNNETLYICGFDLVENEENKKFYRCKAYRTAGQLEELDLLMQRDVYIKYMVFMYNIMTLSPYPELPFLDEKYNKMEFITVKYSKLNATSLDLNTKLCMASYSAGIVPTLYNFRCLSFIKHPEKPLRRPLTNEAFYSLHGKEFIVNNIVYNPQSDKVYVLYENYSDITGEFKNMIVLVFSKEFYEKTNLLSPDYLYEKIN